MRHETMVQLLLPMLFVSVLQHQHVQADHSNIVLPKKPPPPAKCFDHCRLTCAYVCKSTNISNLTFLATIKQRKKPRTELDLSFNNLISLKKNEISVTDFKIIRKLYLENNLIKKVDENALQGLDFLEELYLSGNKLTTLFSKSFDSNSLETLMLDSCGIQNIPGDIFKNTPRLKLINLSNNNLRVLTKGLFNSLGTLEEIHIGGNSLSELSRNTFEGLNNLKIINLTQNLIPHLEEGLFENLPSLKEIHLASNLLTKLDPSTFEKNAGLIQINLANNFIETIPETLFKSHKQLRFINLNNNKLTTLKMHTFQELVENSNNGSLRVGTEYEFNLENNPWNCEGCDMFKVFNWLRENTTQDYHFKWSVMICATPDRFKGKSWTFVPWDDTESSCVEPSTARTLTEAAEVTAKTYEVITKAYDSFPMIAEVKPRTHEVEKVTRSFSKSFSNDSGVRVMEYIRENSNLCYFQYYFLGSYALFVLISACAVWVIIYKEKVTEMGEERFCD